MYNAVIDQAHLNIAEEEGSMRSDMSKVIVERPRLNHRELKKWELENG